ncbi:MAG: sn-glycerol-3-phosphate ABC transporter ATP-binding protein UgpC [Desulfofustis sp.]|jgi:multiple sugar transport system ATP-binding protein|nr:sn-glycerol-3-phosphate ABC transporter ATP-binding protein UgpC [Desulfofustis sp.]
MAEVLLHNVEKKFGNNVVIRDLDLHISDQEFVVLVGPSGCGKSTILRMIAGLEDVTSGTISIGENIVNELAPKDRNIAMVFQDYALYPHLTIFRNISFGLEMQKISKSELQERVLHAAEILGISDLLGRKPKQLSGGQRQRVAMGRAIVRRPSVFLFDEPLSNLDAKLRTQMRTEIKKLHNQLATTIVYVTHDQVEAMTLADRIVVLRDGNIEQVGRPEEVYNNPSSMFVAGFIGAPTMNFLPCRLSRQNGTTRLQINDEKQTALIIPEHKADQYRDSPDQDVVLGIRPEYFSLVKAGEDVSPNQLSLQVNVIEPLGSTTLFFFEMAAAELVVSLDPISGIQPGDQLNLIADMSRIHLFNPQTGKVL